MANRFRDFSKPIKIIFERLVKKLEIKGAFGGGTGGGASVSQKPIITLDEYPCVLIRDSTNRVIEIDYGSALGTGWQWKQEIIRDSSGIVQGVKETLPDGGGTITLYRDTDGKVNKVDYL